MEAADGGRRSTRTRRALGDISNQSETTTSVQVTKIAPKRRLSRTQSDGTIDVKPESNDPSTDHACKKSKTSTVTASASSSSAAATSTLSKHSVVKAAFVVPKRLALQAEPARCLEVLDDLYTNYYALEEKYLVKPYLAKIQVEVTAKMRSILVDWLLEVHYKFKLVPQTLWLCVNILDRYLEKVPVERTKLQLVGVSALLLACKYEESGPPEVKDCIFITDYAYDRAEILGMERSILNKLNYELCVPTGYHFLTKYLQTINATDKLKHLAFYFAERNLQEYDVLNDKPHVFAAASLYVALSQVSQTNITHLFELEYRGNTEMLPSVWTQELVEETKCTEEELIPIAQRLVEHVAEEPVMASKRLLIAARKKYNVDKYYYVSSLLLPQIR